jgi:hypothetical protein
MMDYWSIIPLNLSQRILTYMVHYSTSTDSEASHELDITPSVLNSEQEPHEKEIRLNLLQKSLLHIFGKVHVGKYKMENWKSTMSFYAFTCKEHGMQISYLHGWKKILKCNTCYDIAPANGR